MTNPAKAPEILGSFICRVTDTGAAVWLQLINLGPGEVTPLEVTLHEGVTESAAVASAPLVASYEELKVGMATFDSLKPDTTYYYRLWRGGGADNTRAAVPVPGLTEADLFFRTFPAEGYKQQLDFLLMSCHNPDTSKADGFDGFGVWARIPDIMSQNKNVRFAILAGDQAYGDEVGRRL